MKILAHLKQLLCERDTIKPVLLNMTFSVSQKEASMVYILHGGSNVLCSLPLCLYPELFSCYYKSREILGSPHIPHHSFSSHPMVFSSSASSPTQLSQQPIVLSHF